MSPKAAVAVLAAFTLAVTGCSDGANRVDEAADTTTSVTTDRADDPSSSGDATPADLTGQEVCDALHAEAVAQAIGTAVTDVDSPSVGTPQCSYSFTDGDTLSSVVVAAQRTDDDLGGLTGQDALDYAVEANRLVAGDGAEFDEVTLDGADAAVTIDSEVIPGVLVLVGGRVVTVFSSDLDLEQLIELARVATDGLRP